MTHSYFAAAITTALLAGGVVTGAEPTAESRDRSAHIEKILALKIPERSKVALLSRYVAIGRSFEEIDGALHGCLRDLIGHGPCFCDGSYEVGDYEIHVAFYPDGECYFLSYGSKRKVIEGSEWLDFGTTVDFMEGDDPVTWPKTKNAHSHAIRQHRPWSTDRK